jgi:plasmid stabilization system protein ParE
MTSLRLAARVQQDVERIAEHLRQHEVDDIGARVSEMLGALQLLGQHPLIGRPVADGLRELVIGKGSRGYVARYRYDAVKDEVRVAALRSQREGGFRD